MSLNTPTKKGSWMITTNHGILLIGQDKWTCWIDPQISIRDKSEIKKQETYNIVPCGTYGQLLAGLNVAKEDSETFTERGLDIIKDAIEMFPEK